KELELASLHGRGYAVCYAGAAQTRVVDLTASSLTPRRTVERASMRELVHAFGPAPARLSEHTVPDAYYYPTHRAPRIASPYLKLQLRDADETSLYLDPARVEVLLRYTRAGRLERWLYHGLHSLDVPGLVEHRALWRTLVLLLMAVGACLCALGLAMSVRKILRRHRRLRQRRA
ncbi:MAG: peptidase, partial [Myxococcaceae bacterium]|nr:peptidase [Myxococcaceae bacterium]